MTTSDHLPILQIENVTKKFPGVTALENVSIELYQGEVHAICGENGAGKSTLIKIICGIHPSDSYEGTVRLNGEPVKFHNTSDASKAGIAVIYQELALIREMTVAENIFFGSEPTKGVLIDWNLLYSKTRTLIQQYGLSLNPLARVGDLGVGQQQLVEILKALSKNSKILLLDEPTAALAESEVEILLNIVRSLKEKGITCVYISHKLDEVFTIADRITVLRDGQSIQTLERKDSNKNEIIRLMVGREIKDLFPRRSSEKGQTILAVNDLSVASEGNDKLVLNHISFELRAGEVLGLGGLMGAGRTELLMHIFGGYGKRISGKIYINGQEYFGHLPFESIRRGLVLVSEDRKRYGLLLKKSVGFNLSLSALRQFLRRGFINHNAEIQTNQTFIRALGIRSRGQETQVETLSGGNQQKVVLGKVLMTLPKVIFLDEPTRGIDVGAKVEVYEIINKLTEEGKGVILVSSELPELLAMSDRIIILSNGRIGGLFNRNEATQEAILNAAMKFQ